MIVEMKCEGLDEAMSITAGLCNPADVEAALEGTITVTIMEMTSEIQEKAPSKTGGYRRTIQWSKLKDALTWMIGSPLPLAEWLERGTGLYGPKGESYEIVPVRKKFLKWRAEGGGYVSGQHRADGSWFSKKSKDFHDVFRKKVIHPGIKPMPHFEPVLEKYSPIITERVIDGLTNLVREKRRRDNMLGGV